MRSNLELCRNLWWCWAPFLALFLIRQPNSDVLWFSFQLKLKFKFNAVKDFGFGGLRHQTPALYSLLRGTSPPDFYFLLRGTTPTDPCLLFFIPGDYAPRLLFSISGDYAPRPLPYILYFGGLRPQTPAYYSLLRETTPPDPYLLVFTLGEGGLRPNTPAFYSLLRGTTPPDFYL